MNSTRPAIVATYRVATRRAEWWRRARLAVVVLASHSGAIALGVWLASR
jgi:hypothetical protein